MYLLLLETLSIGVSSWSDTVPTPFCNHLGPLYEIISRNPFARKKITFCICVDYWNCKRAADKNVMFKEMIILVTFCFLWLCKPSISVSESSFCEKLSSVLWAAISIITSAQYKFTASFLALFSLSHFSLASTMTS